MTTPTFFKVKLSMAASYFAINADEIRAVMRADDGRFIIWLKQPLELTNEHVTRMAKLAGVSPISDDCWAVHSSDLNKLLPNE